MKSTTLLLCCLASLLLGGCANTVIIAFMEPTMERLQFQDDVDLVCEGAASYLLMLDSMVVGDPDNKALRLKATQSYVAYAAALDACARPERAAEVSEKSRTHGLALLRRQPGLAEIEELPLEALGKRLAGLGKSEAAPLFWGAVGWAAWIQRQEGSASSMAEILRVEKIMGRVIELDPAFEHGGAHLFLGAYHGAKPAMLGGRPEESRAHFEEALRLGGRAFLPVQVTYAETWCRTMFERERYVELLTEVLAFPLESQPEMTLINQVAKRRAARLLKEVDLYF